MEEQTEIQLARLTSILDLRVKFLREWHAVSVSSNKTKFSIKWHEWAGDPSNSAFFQEITYPIEMLPKIIKSQLNKLKRDLTDTDKEILKSIL